jgi:hypothetical protein
MVLHCIGWGIRILISRLDIVIIAVYSLEAKSVNC